MTTRNTETPVVLPVGHLEQLGPSGLSGIELEPEIGEQRTAGQELTASLSRLAVLHDDPAGRSRDYVAMRQGYSTYSDVIQRGHDEVVPDWFEHTEDSLAKTSALRAIRRAVSMGVLRTVRPRTDRGGSGEDSESSEAHINWGQVAQHLVEAAAHERDEQQRQNNLVAGVIASQFAPNDTDRQDFVLAVYDHGLQADAAQACAGSPLHIVLSTPGHMWDVQSGQFEPSQETTQQYEMQSVSHFATAFTLEPDHLRGYIERTTIGAGARAAEGMRSSKKLRKELMAQTEDGEANQATRDEATVVSGGGEKTGGVVQDPYKIERFALQARFIRKQFAALFGETVQDVTDSQFAKLLRGTRGDRNDTVWAVDVAAILEQRAKQLGTPRTAEDNIRSVMLYFETGVSKAFRQGSEPVIDEFRVADGTARETMSPEQLVEWRYGIVRDKMLRQDVLAQYINYDEFVRRDNQARTGRNTEEHVWSTSEEGAAVPFAARDMLTAVMRQACSRAATLRATPEELLLLLQQNRRPLLSFAAHHIEELAVAVGEDDDEPIVSVMLRRDHDGVLRLDVSMPTMPSKGSLEVYAAELLGCPALPEVHPARMNGELTPEQRLAHGSSNYIDHALAAIFNEAYARGLLSTDSYIR